MYRLLSILVLLLVLAESAFAGEPVVLDVHGKKDTQVFAKSITKGGFPWGWVSELEVVVKVDKPESDDVLLVQHFRGAQKWGPQQKCPLGHYDALDQVAEFTCPMAEALAINTAGQFRAEIAFKRVSANKIHNGIGSLTYTVLKYNCDNRHVNKRFAPSPCFVVDHDFRIGEAWLEENLPRGGYAKDEIDEDEPTRLFMRMWIKTAEKEPKLNLRCSFKGKVISNNGINHRQADVTYHAFPKANGPETTVSWKKWFFAVPDVASRPPKDGSAKGLFLLSQNAGDYKCVVTSDGDQVAELTFAVAADGKIKHAPCLDDTRPTAVTVTAQMHLIKVAFKQGFNLAYNASAYKNGPVFGKRWTTGCPP